MGCGTVNSVNGRDVVSSVDEEEAILSVDGLVTDTVVDDVAIKKEVAVNREEMVTVIFINDDAVFVLVINGVDNDALDDGGVLVDALSAVGAEEARPLRGTRRTAGLLPGAGQQSPFKSAWRASFAGRAGLLDCCRGRDNRAPLNLLGAPALRDAQDCWIVAGGGTTEPL
ncbi:hypothetical protein NDU88_003986 [Pleurodeles waltl]|uniref:Uncharacterized protein n=1 Tax=Pleurodeles waltl TaxID=8319 RepID=A0AAV7LN28_PLEWA|nr:hypothetical protein NDU88_003986 [Pleurodeles waltl]